MEARKTIVNELNELAYKMTGVNPKATTDAQALNYIEQNYQGGGSSGGVEEVELDASFIPSLTDITTKCVMVDDEYFLSNLRSLITKVYSGKNIKLMVVGQDGSYEGNIYTNDNGGVTIQAVYLDIDDKLKELTFGMVEEESEVAFAKITIL